MAGWIKVRHRDKMFRDRLQVTMEQRQQAYAGGQPNGPFCRLKKSNGTNAPVNIFFGIEFRKFALNIRNN